MNDGWRIETGQVWKHKLLEDTAIVTEVASIETGRTGPEGSITYVAEADDQDDAPRIRQRRVRTCAGQAPSRQGRLQQLPLRRHHHPGRARSARSPTTSEDLTMPTTQADRVNQLIDALAEYLTKDQAKLSIELELGKPHAVAWAKVRNASPVRGWATEDEAKESLRALLLP